MNSLQGKTIIVTGGNSGVGAATAIKLAKLGANVVISARRVGALEEVANKITQEGGSVLVVATDISKNADCVA
ncbi:MAG: SDR family NAD(P)-dependent oxidoreductase, partial [Clostridia bacterium]|nr:SDR family NAD(P)-dependent oxidoreductase [Clostridia bacterium]